MHTTRYACRAAVPSPAFLRFLRRQPGPAEPPIRTQRCPGIQLVRYASASASDQDVKLLPAPRQHPSWESAYSRSELQRYSANFASSASSTIPRARRPSSSGDTQRPRARLFSSSTIKSLWNYFGIRKQKGHTSHHGPHNLPPLSSFLDDSQTPGRILKPSNELRIRCTEFDEHGNVTLVNGEFKKQELIAKYGLLPRDLRKIDSTYYPHILVRESAILVNLLHLRVLIKSDRVLVFDAYGSTDSYTQSVFMYDLEGKLRQVDARSNGSLPYEFRALEAVLISVTTGLESEFEGVRDPVLRVLRDLEEDIDRDKLRYLLVYSKKLGTFEQKARLVRDALEELLEADDDLADMYLSEKARGKIRAEDDHTEIEMLLESYHKVTDEIVQAAENLVSNIRNTEEIVRAILDANRNALMLLDLKFSICTLGLGAGTFIAALYGMNLKNFIEESDLGFWGVSAVCAVLSAVVLQYGMRRLRRVQKVSMWGDSPHYGPAMERRSFEERALLGLGRGSAVTGLPGVGVTDPLATKAERARRIADRMEKHREGQIQQQLARKRRMEQKKSNSGNGESSSASAGSSNAPAADYSGSGNGLGTT
ncbi:uncharacterized protein PV09_07706 [Verruconis gallopava]|uniref:Magnesium transporter n=1 Tax=Verruconis gallopava TaxID=253628 RepID=A0A0D1XEU0_9PEZI|nr:uncharacterized protein PV09_07706 [Verruconis gallopava]KIW00721.1 hypothetical protein PV09_07706 [Verruconis gallopava]